jgi:acid phosphatase (class A)
MSTVKASILLAILILFGTVTPAEANLLLISKAEIRKVIGDYPAPGSEEEALEDLILLDYQDTRTQEDCAKAAREQNGETLNKFFGDLLSKREVAILSVKLLRVAAISASNVLIAKKMYKRARPYDRNPEITPCIETESSLSYPSGHTALGRMYARVLSMRFPAREAAFMKRANEIAHNRVLGGVHHPSDIEAGKKLADYLVNKFYKN